MSSTRQTKPPMLIDPGDLATVLDWIAEDYNDGVLPIVVRDAFARVGYGLYGWKARTAR